MGCLLVTILALVLGYANVIGAVAVMSMIFGSLIWSFLAAGLYFKFGFLKFFYHGLLGWHTPLEGPESYDGLSYHARCKYCSKEIMQDSQGNWF